MHGSCVARARPSARCRCRTQAGGQSTGAWGGTGGSNLNYFTYGLINKHLYLSVCVSSWYSNHVSNEEECSVNHERDKVIKVDFKLSVKRREIANLHI